MLDRGERERERGGGRGGGGGEGGREGERERERVRGGGGEREGDGRAGKLGKAKLVIAHKEPSCCSLPYELATFLSEYLLICLT